MYGIGDREKNDRKKIGFSVSIFWHPENRLQKIGLRFKKTEKNKAKKRLSVFVHNTGSAVLEASASMTPTVPIVVSASLVREDVGERVEFLADTFVL